MDIKLLKKSPEEFEPEVFRVLKLLNEVSDYSIFTLLATMIEVQCMKRKETTFNVTNENGLELFIQMKKGSI